MISCDLQLICDKMKGINYDEAVLCAGLNNQLFVGYYAEKSLYMLQGRGFLFADDFLEKLKVDYEMLTIAQLFECEKKILDRVLLVLPYLEFEKIKTFKKNVVQFFNTYSTFSVVTVSETEVTLEGMFENELTQKSISKEDLLYLASLTVKPLPVSLKIIHIKDNEIEDCVKKECINKNMEQLLQTEEFFDRTGGWVKGYGFYDRLKQVLLEEWNLNFNTVAKYVFLQSMQKGSSFFYRREYYHALQESSLGYEVPTELMTAGNAWRKLSRYLKQTIMDATDLQHKYIEQLIEEIKELELYAFQIIKQERMKV